MAGPNGDLTNASQPTVVCYAPTMITTNGIWGGNNPLEYSLPLFIVQLVLIIVITRILVFALKPLRQPRVISEILGGIVLGPSVLGRSQRFADAVFPLRSVMILETMANLGLVYFLFLVGVEMDMGVVRRTGKKAFAIAISGMILPCLIATSFAIFIRSDSDTVPLSTSILFLGVSLSVTAFPVLARILAELKLLNTEIGRIAMSAALVNDMCAWILLAFAIALAENEIISLASFGTILSSAAFVAFCVFVIKPLICWMMDKVPEGESINEFSLCVILTGVMISGFVTDAIGTHSVFGAFVFGLVIPHGSLGVTLVEKLEDFVSGLLLPLFFAISGLKTNMSSIGDAETWIALALVTIFSFLGKVAGTMLVSTYYRMPLIEGLALGLLMNSKGLVEMIVLNLGKDQKVLDDKAFAVMVLAALVMTSTVSPSIIAIYNFTRKQSSYNYKQRTLWGSSQEADLRILVCIHHLRSAASFITLLGLSNPTKKSPISAFVLHLAELTGRDSAVLIVHTGGINRTQSQSDHIISMFRNFENKTPCISIQTLTAVSPYSTMHEDICNVAEDKHAALIIVPFHKQQTVDGGMEAAHPAYRAINENVLAGAPCSVGIFVDRGLSRSTKLDRTRVGNHVAVLFFGGGDDREALAYGLRMSENPSVSLTVTRFLAAEEIRTSPGSEKEKRKDEHCINMLQERTKTDSSIEYWEKIVSHGEDTVAAIRAMGSVHDLFIVGRGKSTESPLLAGITDWCECPELGAIGDLLAAPDFPAACSVLVVQQHVGTEEHGDTAVESQSNPSQTHSQQTEALDSRPRTPPQQ